MTTTTTETETPPTECEETRSLPASVTKVGKVTRDPELRFSPKGDRVIVSGRPEIEEYEKDGEHRTVKKILADLVGAELRFVTVTINKPARRPSTPTDYSDDEEPF